MRSLYWSHGLRQHLASPGFELDGRQDGDVAADEAAAGERLALIPAATWYRHAVRHKGRSLALIKAAEHGGTRAVRALVGTWGLIWGADVVGAETLVTAGAIPTLDETMRRIERTTLAARAEVWRHGFDKAELAAQLKTLKAGADDFHIQARVRKAKQERELTDARAQQAGLQCKAEGKLPSQWWSQTEDTDVLTGARALAREPEPADAQSEFLRRRRIATTAHAAQIAAALIRVRQKTADPIGAAADSFRPSAR
ncbi:hypothetical protein [Streptomyces sp. NPDC054975]